MIVVGPLAGLLPFNEAEWQRNTGEDSSLDLDFVEVLVEEPSTQSCVDSKRIDPTGCEKSKGSMRCSDSMWVTISAGGA